MIGRVEHHWMHIVNNGTPQKNVYYTVDFPAPPRTISASIAITAFSQGFIPGSHAGGVGATVKRFGRVVAPGVVKEFDPPSSFQNNSWFIPGCTFVTFGMAAEKAWAWAVITILFHE